MRKSTTESSFHTASAHTISSPGRGKTTALYHLAREYNGAYIEIGAQQKTMGGMYRGIAEAIGATIYGTHEREIWMRSFGTSHGVNGIPVPARIFWWSMSCRPWRTP